MFSLPGSLHQLITDPVRQCRALREAGPHLAESSRRCLLVAQLCPAVCNRDCSSPGSFVYGIFQARILEWVAISSSRASSPPRARTCIFCSSYIGRQIFTPEIPGKPVNCFKGIIILFNPHNGMRHCFIILYKWGLPWCLRW